MGRRATQLFLGCICSYVMGLCWFMLFPLISVTTGELKPRGIYVDEHALLTTSVEREEVNIQNFNYFKKEGESNVPSNFVANTDICDVLSRELLVNFPCRVYTSVVDPIHTLTTVLVRPKDRPSSDEEYTVVVVKLSPCGDTPGWVVDLSIALMLHLRSSMWLSKTVIFIFTPPHPSSSPEHSPLLSRWVHSFHHSTPQVADIGSTFDFDFSPFKGVMRDAVVLDLLALPRMHSPSSSDVVSSCSLPSPVMPTSWAGGALLAVTGNNGQLPNMDTPASLLSLEPQLVHLEGEAERDRLEGYTASLPYSMLSHVFAAEILRVSQYYWASLLLGLRKMMWGADGWHGVFLAHNVEAFSLKLLDPSSQKNARRKRGSGGRTLSMTPNRLLSLLVRYMHCSSNLHEELHHSGFLYLLMGPRHFVGMPEYACCLLLLVLPFFLLWLSVVMEEVRISSYVSGSVPTSGHLSYWTVGTSKRAGGLSLLLDAVVGVCVCVLGRSLLPQLGSSFDIDLDHVKGRVSAAALAHSALFCLGPDEDWVLEWCLFTVMCCALYGSTLLLFHMLSPRWGVVVWFRGYVSCFMLLIACLMSLLAMHHSALAFALVVPAVPLAAVLFLAHSYSSSSTSTGSKRYVWRGVCLVCGILTSPVSLLVALHLTSGGFESFRAILSPFLVGFREEGSVLIPYTFFLGWVCSCAFLRTALQE